MSLTKQSLIEFLAPELEATGVELVTLELSSSKKPLLRLYVDKIGETKPMCTLTVADCENISRTIQRLIDVEGIIPGDYTLEVSTPGLERSLSKASDYLRFKGKSVNVVIAEPVGGSFDGKILDVDKDKVTFDVAGKKKELLISEIKRAKLKFER